MKIKRGSTSVRRLIFVADSSSTVGAGLTGLAYNTSGLVAYYFAGDLSNEVQITLASATLGSWTSGGFIEVDATNMPGWYEVGIPDAALDGGNEVAIQYRGATNMVPVNIYIELDAVDYQSATNFGLSKFGDIEADTQDIQSRLPASLTGGRMVSYVEDVGTSAQSQVANAVANLDPSGKGADTLGGQIARTYTNSEEAEIIISAIVQDTIDIQSRLPAALVGGRMDASVGAMSNNVITAAAMASDALGEIADAVWDEAYSEHTTAGTFGKLMDTLRKANMVVDGVVTSAVSPTTTSFSSTVNYPTGAFKHAVLLWVNGPSIAEQNSPILTYTNTDGVITVEEAFTSAPQVGDEFIIIPTTHVHAIAAIQSGLATSSGVTSAFTEIKGATWSSSTDTLEAIRDSSGGGGTLVIAPIQAEVPPRSVETLLRVYRGETVNQIVSVVESDGTTPVDLSGKSLEIVFEGYLGTDLAVIATANITVSGDDNNVVTFAYPSAVTATVGRYYWSLRDDAAPSQVYLNGEVEVLRAAVNDP